MSAIAQKKEGKYMELKFKSGDRVKTTPNLPRFDYVGTVIGYDEDGIVLVKFDNFTDDHGGSSFYSSEDITYDPKNRQHLWVHEETLCLLEGEVDDN